MRRNVIDRLALLCTLHADGPKTLRLLREAGCTTLDHLRDLEPNRLAEILSLPNAAARRLLREVIQLQERLEPALEREESMYPPGEDSDAEGPAPPAPPKVGPAPAPAPRVEEATAANPPAAELTARAHLDLRDRQLLDQVVDRWRQADESSRRPGEVESLPSGAPSADEDPAAETELEAPAPSTRLHPGELDGLDRSACEALRRGGIDSLEALASCPVEGIIERSRLSFTRARTLQFLAGRRLAEVAGHDPSAPERIETITPTGPKAEECSAPVAPKPRLAPHGSPDGDEGVGGPFA